jgi:hypothetical protein
VGSSNSQASFSVVLLLFVYNDRLCGSLLQEVLNESVSEEVLEERLYEHVEAKDMELSLDGGKDDVADTDVTNTFYMAGIDTDMTDMRTLYAKDFKIRIW